MKYLKSFLLEMCKDYPKILLFSFFLHEKENYLKCKTLWFESNLQLQHASSSVVDSLKDIGITYMDR